MAKTITHNQVREIADLVGIDIQTMLMILDELRRLND